MKRREGLLGPDRAIEIQTDDEENTAERDCHENWDYTESDNDVPSRAHSDQCLDHHNSFPHWPQSYRLSMDAYSSLTPPSLSFIRGGSFTGDAREALLPKPLISTADNGTSTTSISELSQHQQCSYGQSVLNAVNVLCGIGILSTPYALKEGGWLSLILLFIFGVITCYTGILLQRCLESSSQLKTYPDIGQAAFGSCGRICIAAILYAELYSSCVELLIMMSDNLSATFPNVQMDVAGIHLDSYQICAIASALVILPTVWLRNLSLLSYISVGGVVTLAIVVLCLLWAGFDPNIGFHPSGKALDLTRLPITIGIYSFCYGSHSVFPNIYSSMQEPSRFPSVLVISFFLSGLLYAGVAVCGYLMFGEATNPQFTLNLPTNLVVSKVAGWSVILAPLTKFGLTMTPVALSLEEFLPRSRHFSHSLSILMRTMLVISTLIVALIVPYFGSVMALIGSFLVMLVSVVLPCACYMKIDQGKLARLEIVTCSVTMIVGVLCAIIGTYSALSSIAEK